ncbi:MAG: hypothetical protein ACJA1Z_003197 [Patiriisocius sp.]|jgi:two-component system LytT family sensor kinase
MINLETLKKLITAFLHVSAWILLFLFFLFNDKGPDNELSLAINLIGISAFLLPYLGLFYFNSLVIVKRYFITKRFKKFFLLLFVSSLVVNSLVSFLEYLEYLDCCAGEDSYSLKYVFLDNLFFSLFVLGLSFSYSFLILWVNNEKLKKESELKLLKSQMNPHFLFNSLNTLYALVSDKELEKAEDAILKLSDLLRYSVYQVNSSSISLEDEINYIKNYISLQELRLDDKVAISFNCKGNTSDVFIEPMLLIPFVENAFKYGVSYVHESKISFELLLTENDFTFQVINVINEKPNVIDDQFSGVGIANVVARLELLYPKNHVFKIESKNGIYSVFLSIKNIC